MKRSSFTPSYRIAWLISILLCGASAQGSQQSSDPMAGMTIQDSAQTPGLPFDHLELLAFLTAQPDVPYAITVVRRRGVNFSNDAACLESLRIHGVTPELVDAIGQLKPVAIVTASPGRANAFGYLTNAIIDKNKGKVSDALADYKRALQDAEDSATLHMAYAGQLIRAKNYSEAEAQYRKSLVLWPDNVEAMVWLASSLSFQSRDSEAVPILRKALALYPDHTPGMVMLGMALARNRQFSEALPVLQGVISKHPQMSVVHKMLGLSLLETGDAQGAAFELDTYLKTNADNAEAHYFLGVAYRQLGKADDSHQQFSEAARIDPNNPIYAALLTPEKTQTATDSDSAGLDQIANTIYSLRFSAPPTTDSATVSPQSGSTDPKSDETAPKVVAVAPVQIPSAVTILTPTEGVDFRPYLDYFLSVMKRKWYDAMPEIAINGAKGKAVLIFGINKDGTLEEGPSVESSSGVTRLDEAAQTAIRASAPFDALPAEFKGPYIRIRVIFLYNLPLDAAQK